MANPTINSRPQKTISGYDSDWVACGGKLPVIYEVENTKFPTNSEDATNSVTAVADNGGKAQLTVTAHPYTAGQYVTLSGFDPEDNYNTIARVISDDGANSLTVDVDFTANDTGSIQLHYYNYAIEVRVYAGIDSAHPHTAEDPVSLIGTIKQIPGSDNIAKVDVSQYVKTKLSSKYDPTQASWPNDLNAWTDFYIEYREVYLDSSTSFTDDSSNFLGHAVYNALQFGNAYGGNLYGYVLDDATYAPTEPPFLTNFEKPVKFTGQDLELSLISELDDLVLLAGDTSTFYSNNGYGVYRLPVTLDSANDYAVSVQTQTPVSEANLRLTSVSATMTPTGITFGDSGSKLYITDNTSNEAILEYDLSTPYDLNTLTFNQQRGFFAATGSRDNLPLGIDFVTSTRVDVIGEETNDYYTLSLSSAWDISTANFSGLTAFTGYTAQDFDFVSTQQIYAGENSVYKGLPTTTSSYTPAEVSSITGVTWNGTGSSFFVLDGTKSIIYEYSAVFYAFSGVTLLNTYVLDPDKSYNGLYFNNDILYLTERTEQKVLSIDTATLTPVSTSEITVKIWE